MRKFLFITITIFSNILNGQEKINPLYYDHLKEVQGTEYVIAYNYNRFKTNNSKENAIIFINTKTGEKNQVDFPKDIKIGIPEQIKIDSLDINLLFVSVRLIDHNENNKIDYNDPSQIIILSTDGKTKTQLTNNDFFVKHLAFNKNTGTIVVTGYFDTNKNNKYDNDDKSEIIIYDLKTLKEKNKI